jgi:molecular chaperone GrpE
MLETEGVSLIEAEGQFFDPTMHEAITHEPHPELGSGQIIEVVKQGYRLGERVLRPAQVRVAS